MAYESIYVYIPLHIFNIFNISWLVVSTPLKNMSSSIGMMTFPTEWKIKVHVPVITNQIYIYINPNKSPFSNGFPMVFQTTNQFRNFLYSTCSTCARVSPSSASLGHGENPPRTPRIPDAESRLGASLNPGQSCMAWDGLEDVGSAW